MLLLSFFALFSLSAAQTFNVLDYGAKGDGETNNTLALQTCINDIGKAGGGLMLFPANSGKFISGSLFLVSNIIVEIQTGAALYGSTDHSDYPWIYTRAGGTMEMAQASLVNGGTCLNLQTPLDPNLGDQCQQWNKLTNITLRGGGIIDGQGSVWWDNTTETRPTLLGLLWVDGLLITNLSVQNSPFWTVHPTFCNNVEISFLNIYAPSTSHNTDGIDPDSCTNVYIHDCTIDTGDDCIAVKSGKDLNGRLVGLPTSNVLITRMQFLHGHGVSIGSEMSGGVNNVTFSNCNCQGTNIVARVKTCIQRGGIVEDIYYYNFTAADVQMAISINMEYSCDGPVNASAIPIFRNIFVQNLTVSSADQTGEFICLENSPCTGINLADVSISKYTDGYDCQYASGTQTNVTPKACLTPEF